MNDYLVISSLDLGELCKLVVDAMDDGYYPLGNITVFEHFVEEFDDSKLDRMFYQAMASYKQ
jgi:hypothetical protein